MLDKAWMLLKETVTEYINDGAMSRGAAIAYYTVFSIAPLLVICIAIAGLVFGEEAARGAIVEQLRGLMGKEGAEAVQSMVESASNVKAGIWATVIGVVTLLVTSTGVFGELQTSLNAIWKAQPSSDDAVTDVVKTRALGLGLVASLGFLLIVSLVVSTGLSALGDYLNALLPGMGTIMQVVSFLVSFVLVAALFAVIYKVLPDRVLSYRDVAIGAVVTAFLFTVGKTLISLYIGSSQVASSYGAAGALIVVLLWVYYSSQIFLLGAEFTKVWSIHYGTMAGQGDEVKAPEGPHPSQAQPAPSGAAASKPSAPAAGVAVARHAARTAPVRWLDVVAVAGVLLAVLRPPRPR